MQDSSVLFNKYQSIIDKFNEIAYRKVTAIDEYGEENWDAFEKEYNILIVKIAKKEGIRDKTIKEWKQSWRMPTEYQELKSNLAEYFIKYYKDRKRNKPKTQDVSKMSGVEFETYIAGLLKGNGFNVIGTPTTGDQGADLIAKKDDKTIVIQAKRYEGSVGNSAVQEVTAAIRYYNGDEGWVITNSTFTQSAKELAHKNNIKLIGGNDLEKFYNTTSTISSDDAETWDNIPSNLFATEPENKKIANSYHKEHLAIEGFLRNNKITTSSELTRKMQHMKKQERDSVIANLLESETIEKIQEKQEGSQKPTTYYKWIGK